MTNSIAASTDLPTAKLDLKYHRAMDISTPAGFASGPQRSLQPQVDGKGPVFFCLLG